MSETAANNTYTAKLNVASVKTVPERLRALGDLYADRNALYGDNYKHFGKVLVGMFPHGITLNNEEDFNRFCLFLQVVHKATRYARSICDSGHADSLDDTAVYTQMLREYDEEMAIK